MLKQLLTLFFVFFSAALMAQAVNPMYADTFIFKSKTGKTEIVFKNSTDTIPGFLFNAGNGRMLYKRALARISDSVYLIGADTLRIKAAQGGITAEMDPAFNASVAKWISATDTSTWSHKLSTNDTLILRRDLNSKLNPADTFALRRDINAKLSPFNGSLSQYVRGDNSLATLDKTAVDLALVPNIDATNPANTLQDAAHRYTTDAEKLSWSAKQNAIVGKSGIIKVADSLYNSFKLGDAVASDTITASTLSGGNLVLRSTRHPTAGKIIFGGGSQSVLFDEAANRFYFQRPGVSSQYLTPYSTANENMLEGVSLGANQKPLRIRNTATGATATAGQADIQIQAQGSSGSYFNSILAQAGTGFVGINNASPYAWLHVKASNSSSQIIAGTATDSVFIGADVNGLKLQPSKPFVRLGVGSTNNGANLQVPGNMSLGTLLSNSATLTLDSSASDITYNGGGAAIWNLPPPSGHEGWFYNIKNRGVQAFTITGSLYEGRGVSSTTILPGEVKRFVVVAGTWNVEQRVTRGLTVLELPNYAVSADSSLIDVAGYYKPGDGGGGQFYWSRTSTATPVQGMIIQPSYITGSGRFIRILKNNTLNALDFGAKGDYSFDNTTPLQTMFDYAVTINAAKCVIPSGAYLFTRLIIGHGTVSVDSKTSGLQIEGMGMPTASGPQFGGTGLYSTASGGAAIATDTTLQKNITFRNFGLYSNIEGNVDTGFHINHSRHSFWTWENVDFSGFKVCAAQELGTGNANGEFNKFYRCKFRRYTDIGYYHNASQAVAPVLEDCRFEPYYGATDIYFKANPGGQIIGCSVTHYGTYNPNKPSLFLRVGHYQYDVLEVTGGRNEQTERIIQFDDDASDKLVHFKDVTFIFFNQTFKNYDAVDLRGVTNGVAPSRLNATFENCEFRSGTGITGELKDFRINSLTNSGLTLIFNKCNFNSMKPAVSTLISNTTAMVNSQWQQRGKIDFNDCTISILGTTYRNIPFDKSFITHRINTEENPFRLYGTQQNLLQNSNFTPNTGADVSAASPWVHLGNSSFVSVSNMTPGNVAGNTVSPDGKIIQLAAGSGIYQDIPYTLADTSKIDLIKYRAAVTIRDSGYIHFSLVNPTTGRVYDSVTYLNAENYGWSKSLISLVAIRPKYDTGSVIRLKIESDNGNTVAFYWQHVGNKFDAQFAPTGNNTVNGSLQYDVIAPAINAGTMLHIPVKDSTFRISTGEENLYIEKSNGALKQFNPVTNTWNVVSSANGKASLNGTGSTTSFTIAHNLSGIGANSKVFITPRSSDAAGIKYVSIDGSNIMVFYTTPPPSGANNLQLDWQIVP